MKTIIMAGGKGTRISKLFPNIPKPLIPISNGIETKPVLEWEICSLYVERQYVYLDLLEKRIGALIDSGKENIFGSEGERYLKDYPMVLNFIDLFYKMFCPLLFSAINIVRIIVEWINNGPRLSTWCDTIVCTAIFVITWFYFFNIHKKITAWFMKCRLIKGIANFLNRCLKEV